MIAVMMQSMVVFVNLWEDVFMLTNSDSGLGTKLDGFIVFMFAQQCVALVAFAQHVVENPSMELFFPLARLSPGRGGEEGRGGSDW